MPDQDELPEMTVAELDALCLKTIRELKDRMDAYDERTAIATEALVDGKTTDERAIEALQRAERFPGEHDVARAWLKNSSTARRWSRNGQ